MKKIILTPVLMLFTLIAISQSFNGIELGKNYATTKAELIAKGFTFDSQLSDNIYCFKGKIGTNPDGKVMVVCTAKTKIVWKFSVYAEKSYTWYVAKESFEGYLKILTEKYGEPTKKYTFFVKPYFEGDDYEIQALHKDKCFFFVVWGEENTDAITLQLKSNDGEEVITVINYENKLATIKKQQEEKEIANKTF